ncbi:MAG: MFS transporter [Clostridia bacterium]|nr:MFS transporter [Clostridia bacterium]
MTRSLNKKWKEFLFAASGFGPNFLMVLMGAYFTNAMNPAAMGVSQEEQTIVTGVCFIAPTVFPILYALSKAFDGIIDIPFAHIADNLSTKFGRCRPIIAVCFLPMVLAYVMCWIPVGGAENPMFNTVWIFLWCIVFFSTYTMSLITFYGSLSTACADEPQRMRVSGYKAFFDTISYCLVYALVPVILQATKLHIDKFAFVCLPMMLTILIPLFLVKEGEKYGYPENRGEAPQKISLIESLQLTFRNRVFLSWTAVNCCTFFGLQMFLVGMNAMIIGGMGFNGAEMALANTCAFAPVPVMLYFFNKLKVKKGVRFTYQSCLLAFAVAIMSFFLASIYVTGGNKPVQYVIACGGGVMGSWAIGAFFMMPYLATSQISSVEEQLTGKNHSAMYFAANAVTSSIVGAISGSFIFESIKNLFTVKGGGLVWASSVADAARQFGVDEIDVYNFGTMIVPFIVCAVCIIGFFLAFLMPKDFSAPIVAKEFKRFAPDLDISRFENEKPPVDRQEIIFVQVGLTVLSGFLFGFIWAGLLLRAAKAYTAQKATVLRWLLACVVPLGGIVVAVKTHKRLVAAATERGVALKDKTVWLAISCAVLPVLGLNPIALGLLQSDLNRIYAKEDALSNGVTV